MKYDRYEKGILGVVFVCVVGLIVILMVISDKASDAKERVKDLEIDLKICQEKRDENWVSYKVCEEDLAKCKERKPLEERLKNMTLQDVIADVQEIQQMVQAFTEKRGQ